MIKNIEIAGHRGIQERVVLDFVAPYRSKIAGTRYESNYFNDNKTTKLLAVFGDSCTGKSDLLDGVAEIMKITGTGDFNIAPKLPFVARGYTPSYSIELDSDGYTFKHEVELSSETGTISRESFYRNGKAIYIKGVDNNIFADKRLDSLKHLGARKSGSKNHSKRLNGIECHGVKLVADDDRLHEAITKCKEISRDFEYIYPFKRSYRNGIIDQSDVEIFEKYREESLDFLKVIDDRIDDFSINKYNLNNFITLYRTRPSNHSFYGMKYEHESNSIKDLIDLLPNILRTIYEGGLMLIDNLGKNWHTVATVKIINMLQTQFSKGEGQFVITTNNEFLFDIEILHPSQIYMTQIGITKDGSNYTTKLVKLSDFATNKYSNRKAYQNYLRGDYLL